MQIANDSCKPQSGDRATVADRLTNNNHNEIGAGPVSADGGVRHLPALISPDCGALSPPGSAPLFWVKVVRPEPHGKAFIARVRVLWDCDYSITEIGNILGVTRNVVHGISTRNGFPVREHPIKRRTA